MDAPHRRVTAPDASMHERLATRRAFRRWEHLVRSRCGGWRASVPAVIDPCRRPARAIVGEPPCGRRRLRHRGRVACRGGGYVVGPDRLPLCRNGPRVMRTAIWLLLAQASLGAFDTLYYHEYRLK